MKKLLFILLLASCSKIDVPKGNYQADQDVFIRADSRVVSKAYDISYYNTNVRDGQIGFGFTGKDGNKLIFPADYIINSKQEFQTYFADGQDVVIRSRGGVQLIYDTIAYIPNKAMREFSRRVQYFILNGEYDRLYYCLQNDLVAIPITGTEYLKLERKGAN